MLLIVLTTDKQGNEVVNQVKCLTPVHVFIAPPADDTTPWQYTDDGQLASSWSFG